MFRYQKTAFKSFSQHLNMPLYRLKYHHDCWSNPAEKIPESRITFSSIFRYDQHSMAGLFSVKGTEAEKKRIFDAIRNGPGVRIIKRKGDHFFIVSWDDHAAFQNFYYMGCVPFPNISINGGIEEIKIFGFSQKNLKESIKFFVESMNDFKIIEKKEIPFSNFGLSFKEKEAFDLANSSGYFEIPRKTTLDELASSLGIGKSAFEERIRKAQIKMVRAYSTLSV